MSQGYCSLPGCEGFCCVHLDKRITQLEAELQAANNRHRSGKWRIGGQVPLNVYEDDRPMFQCHTPEDAERIVALLNGAEAANNQVRELEEIINVRNSQIRVISRERDELEARLGLEAKNAQELEEAYTVDEDQRRKDWDELEAERDRALSELAGMKTKK